MSTSDSWEAHLSLKFLSGGLKYLRELNISSRIMVRWTLFVLLWSFAFSDDAIKNHRAEKRQDDSFIFFGGWRPLRPGSPSYLGAASHRYHDILSALPNSYDSAASYYTHALPSQYHKDIYSYYPRPAIKATPKKNTPVYMERYRPQMPKQKQGPRGVSNPAPQFIDLQNIDFSHLKDLHNVILQAKNLPLTPLNLPIESTKPVEIVQISLQSLQQGNQNYGFSSSNNGYGRPRNSQRNRKSNFRRGHQSRRPAQSPAQYQYITLPKPAPILPQVLPKEIEISPIHLPQHSVSLEEVIGVKNIQIVEVPSVVPYEIQNGKGSSKSQYSKSSSRLVNQQYRAPSKGSPQKGSSTLSYYTHQVEEPRKQYASAPVKTNHIQHQPEIEAELVKLSEEELKHLLSNLQILDKDQHNLLKYLPLHNIQNLKEENIQLVVSLPEGGNNHGENSPVRNYESQHSSYQNSGYETEKQHSKQPQPSAYSSKEPETYAQNTGGYSNHNYENHQNSQSNGAGYQVEEPRSHGGHYEQNNYQSLDDQSGYDQQQDYHSNNQQEQKSSYQQTGEQYSKSNQESSQGSSGKYTQQQPSYIEVIAPQTDQNGYRREPVLAIEIQHGQSIEDAIKSLDPETLQKLGTHGKNGIEIEVVEVPVDDYVSESKKTETVVSARNSTVIIRPKKKTTEKS
ncbi:uncharacterized protein TNIN_19151 [Trichonephila inaurata madagascariensis]|uniref:Uncharacterized protein n=1 Tax=Trichonephila inaurata madagascariensis TaxID=2747483 RepID=A0A8X6IRS9_9ARAC|nr:uncharacterized protein TNIN_19151 [Trichonephila inaurata madagascariensis]